MVNIINIHQANVIQVYLRELEHGQSARQEDSRPDRKKDRQTDG